MGTDIFVAAIAFIVVVTLIYIIGVREGIWPSIFDMRAEFRDAANEEFDDPTELDEDENTRVDEDDDDDDEDEYDDDEDDDDEEAADIIDFVERRDLMRMKYRMENPRLFADTWYDDSYLELSRHAVRHDQEAREYQKRMGIRVRGIAA